MNILIGADLVPTEKNIAEFEKGDAEFLVGSELLTILRSADFRIFNMEVPLTDKSAPIKKCGPNLIAPTVTIKGYKALGTDIVTLANNHILDQGVAGLHSTEDALKQSGIAYLGVGDDPTEACKPFIFECDGKKIGIYACAEHEFSIVTDDTPGANPYDPLYSFDHVASLKKDCEFVIVLYHGGKEHYRYPSPMLQRVCRKFVESGAGLVICQHSHCIGCEEHYNGGTIVYGQGNFLFDHSTSAFWQTSLLIRVGDNFAIDYIPLVKAGSTVRLASEAKQQEIMDGFSDRSKEILQDGFVEKRYRAFADEMINGYLLAFSGKRRSFILRILNKLTRGRYVKWFLRHRYSEIDLLVLRNYIECETHREMVGRGLYNEYK